MVDLPFPPNDVRWPRDRGGHYESFYLKANAPDRKLGLWLKHSLMAAKGSDAPPFGESWAVLMDGDRGVHRVAKRVVPADEVEINPLEHIIRLGEAVLDDRWARGAIPAGNGLPSASWELRLRSKGRPLLHYPSAWLYTAGFPKKKVLTPRPFVRFDGTLQVGDEQVEVREWYGLQGHNWGRAHAVDYAYGNANRFEERDDARFDGVTARIALLGPLTSPRLTACVLRLGDTDYAFNKPGSWMRSGCYAFPKWQIHLDGVDGHRLIGTIEATRREFVGLRYADPAGPLADCLNTKFARGTLLLQRKVGRRWEEVQRLTGDAFELEFLLRGQDHGVPVVGGNPFDEV